MNENRGKLKENKQVILIRGKSLEMQLKTNDVLL